MVAQGIGAIVIEPGTTMHYYSDVDWHPSERTFAMVIPASGAPAWVCPAFEEARARELIRFGDDVRVWQEDENPSARIAGILKDRGMPRAARSAWKSKCDSSSWTGSGGPRHPRIWSRPRR